VCPADLCSLRTWTIARYLGSAHAATSLPQRPLGAVDCPGRHHMLLRPRCALVKADWSTARMWKNGTIMRLGCNWQPKWELGRLRPYALLIKQSKTEAFALRNKFDPIPLTPRAVLISFPDVVSMWRFICFEKNLVKRLDGCSEKACRAKINSLSFTRRLTPLRPLLGGRLKFYAACSAVDTRRSGVDQNKASPWGQVTVVEMTNVGWA